MVVNLIAETCVSDLVHSFKLLKADGIPVRHDEPVERNGKACLAKGFNALDFAEDLRAGRNEKLPAVVGVDIVGDQAFDGTSEIAVETV